MVHNRLLTRPRTLKKLSWAVHNLQSSLLLIPFTASQSCNLRACLHSSTRIASAHIENSSNKEECQSEPTREKTGGNTSSKSFTFQKEKIEKQELKGWREIFSSAWRDYKYTWEGFNDNLTRRDSNDVDDGKSPGGLSEIIQSKQVLEKQKELQENVRRNVNTIGEEGSALVGIMKGATGIENKQDLKIWTMEQLKLANQCVASFMEGYRQGRDDEVDKMLNQYFKDIDFKGDVHGDEKLLPKKGRKTNKLFYRRERRRRKSSVKSKR